MYFSRIITWLFRRKKATLAKFLVVYKISNKSARKCNFLLLNCETLLNYLPLINSFFTSYNRDSATFKLLK